MRIVTDRYLDLAEKGFPGETGPAGTEFAAFAQFGRSFIAIYYCILRICSFQSSGILTK